MQSRALQTGMSGHLGTVKLGSELTEHGFFFPSEGIEKTLERMLAADPHFILGKVVSNLLQLIGTGTSGRKDPQILNELRELQKSVAVSSRSRLSRDEPKFRQAR